MSRTFEELTPQNFSFNSPLGWCPACEGLGVETGTDQSAVIANPHLSLSEGAVAAWPTAAQSPAFMAVMEAICGQLEIPFEKPWYQLTPRQQRMILQGAGERWFEVEFGRGAEGQRGRGAEGQRGRGAEGNKSPMTNENAENLSLAESSPPPPVPPSPRPATPLRVQYKGIYPAVEEAARVSYTYRLRLQDLVGEKPCSVCNGDRIRDDAAAVRLAGKTLPELCRLPLDEVLEFLQSLELDDDQQRIAGDLLHEAVHRLAFLIDVGLHYLTLDRGMPTLSGGESQRIRLAGQIGRALTGVLYVLDEPTIGLHPRDNGRLIDALHKLRDLGNTIVLVEHDREVIESADRLYDFGPGSGRFGGSIVAEGTPKQISRRGKASLTGAYLAGAKGIPVPKRRRMARREDSGVRSQESGKENDSSLRTVRNDESLPSAPLPPFPSAQYSPPGGGWLEITGCRQNNLRGVDLRIPLGTLTCVTGLSGSGKSSLVQETLARAVARHLKRQGPPPGPFETMTGAEWISRVITVDQQPIGATPASNPATYTGVFDPIRELFSKLPDAKIRGYKPGRFSFNRSGGRCEDCEGMGQKKIEMHFLPDVWVECETCRGKRYNQETLAVRYRERSIADVLELSIGQALELFENIPKIRAPLATLAAIGLDYLTLGQSATTLSGGESQRVKLAAELCKPNNGRTLYLLDEPTTGLHFDDIAKLLKVLNSLVEQGNTVVVIEHNLDVIKTADWMIDVGPEAGVNGGWIVAEGTPEDVVAQAERYLAGNGRGEEGKRGRGEEGKRRRGEEGKGEDKSPMTNPPSSMSNENVDDLSLGIEDLSLKHTLPPPPSSPSPAVLSLCPSSKLRSWTGELLRPVLERDERGELDLFDVAEAAKKRTGDMDIAKVGREVAAPWQTDGRKWHTQSRISRSGKPCRWEGEALEYVVDRLAEHDGLKEANWNDQASVEITAQKKTGTGWFFHALTGDEWLLRLCFRVPKGTFEEADLRSRLRLASVNDLDELPIYNRSERVRVNQKKGPFQEVVLDVHWKEEIDTDAFRSFLEDAVRAYLGQVETSPFSPADLMPWKVLGRKWHLTRKGFPSDKRVAWKLETLEALLDLLDAVFSGLEPDWSNKTRVTYRDPESQETVVELQTKRRDGIYLSLLSEPGRFALGQIASLGKAREIVPHRSGKEAIRIQLTTAAHVSPPKLRAFLEEFVRSLE